MKNARILGIIAIAAIMVFSITACKEPEGEIEPWQETGIVYLGSGHWGEEGDWSGEQYASGAQIKLSDLSDYKPQPNDRLNFKISGTSSVKFKNFQIELFQFGTENDWATYTYLGESNSPDDYDLDIDFTDVTVSAQIWGDNTPLENREIYIQIKNMVWKKNPEGEYVLGDGTGAFPENAAPNAFMQTVSNFSMSLESVTNGREVVWTPPLNEDDNDWNETGVVYLGSSHFDDGQGNTGDQYGSGAQIKLSDFTDYIPEQGDTLQFKISGTSTDKFKNFLIELFQFQGAEDDWSSFHWLGGSPQDYDLDNPFTNATVVARIDNAPISNREYYVQIKNVVWQQKPDGSYLIGDGSVVFPPNVPFNYEIQTVSDFLISLEEVTNGGEVVWTPSNQGGIPPGPGGNGGDIDNPQYPVPGGNGSGNGGGDVDKPTGPGGNDGGGDDAFPPTIT